MNALKAAVSLCAFSTPRPSRQDDWSLRGATLAVRLRRLLGLVAKTPGRAATQTYLDCSSFKVTNGQLMSCDFFFLRVCHPPMRFMAIHLFRRRVWPFDAIPSSQPMALKRLKSQ